MGYDLSCKHDNALRSQKAMILTALPVEYKAVRTELTDLHEVIHPQGTVYELGKFASAAQMWEIGIVEIGQGNPTAAVEAERAIQYFKPDVILFVGVAGGIKDVTLGDVVAVTKVYGYEFGKDEESFRPRPNVGNSTYRLEQRARAEAKKTTWVQRINDASSSRPRAFVSPIAAGDKVVSSTKSATYKFIRSNFSDALAVEMEGYGFMGAVHANPGIEALIIRGISDLIDDKNTADAHGYQEIAARNASAFAFEVLASFEFPSEATDWGRRAELDLSNSLQISIQETSFRSDPRIDDLIKNVRVGDWDAARDAAIELLEATDASGSNALFEALLRYQDCPYDEDLRWGAIITIESFAELAPCLFDHELLDRMARHPDFSIRASAASICMTLAQFAPDRVPVDILLKLARHDEDVYVIAPATAALKAMARQRPATLRIFFKRLHSPDPYAREHAAEALADIANIEPEILDPKELERELSRLKQIGDQTSRDYIATALPKAKRAVRISPYKYGI